MKVIINAEIQVTPQDTEPVAGQRNFYANILGALGYNQTLPVAAFLKKYHQLEGNWLVVSPIHWIATHNDAMILASGEELHLTDAESQYYFSLLAAFWGAENRVLYFHNANMWLLQVDNAPTCSAASPYLLCGKSIMPALATIDSTLYWQRVLTEIQMLMSSKPFKSPSGSYPVNGVWIWGAGQCDQETSPIPVVALDESSELLANVFSTPITQEEPWPSSSLVLVNEWPVSPELTIKLSTQNSTWFWNNCAYHHVKKHWWSRFQRSKK